jgi:hypothetical protein
LGIKRKRELKIYTIAQIHTIAQFSREERNVSMGYLGIERKLELDPLKIRSPYLRIKTKPKLTLKLSRFQEAL